MKFFNVITLFAIAATASPLAASNLAAEGVLAVREPGQAAIIEQIIDIKTQIEQLIATGGTEKRDLEVHSDVLDPRQNNIRDLLNEVLGLISDILNNDDGEGPLSPDLRKILNNFMTLLVSLIN